MKQLLEYGGWRNNNNNSSGDGDGERVMEREGESESLRGVTGSEREDVCLDSTS